MKKEKLNAKFGDFFVIYVFVMAYNEDIVPTLFSRLNKSMNFCLTCG